MNLNYYMPLKTQYFPIFIQNLSLILIHFPFLFFQVSFVFQSRCTYRSVSIVYKSINLQRTNQFGAKFMFSHLQFHKLFVCHLWFHRFHFVVIESNIWYLPQTMIAHMYPPLRVNKTIPSLNPNATSTVCC